jgi:hypothetical protein
MARGRRVALAGGHGREQPRRHRDDPGRSGAAVAGYRRSRDIQRELELWQQVGAPWRNLASALLEQGSRDEGRRGAGVRADVLPRARLPRRGSPHARAARGGRPGRRQVRGGPRPQLGGAGPRGAARAGRAVRRAADRRRRAARPGPRRRGPGGVRGRRGLARRPHRFHPGDAAGRRPRPRAARARPPPRRAGRGRIGRWRPRRPPTSRASGCPCWSRAPNRGARSALPIPPAPGSTPRSASGNRSAPYRPIPSGGGASRRRGPASVRAAPRLAMDGADPEAAFDAAQRYKARTMLERILGPGEDLPDAREAPPITLRDLQGAVLRPGEVLLDAFAGARPRLAVRRHARRLPREAAAGRGGLGIPSSRRCSRSSPTPSTSTTPAARRPSATPCSARRARRRQRRSPAPRRSSCAPTACCTAFPTPCCWGRPIPAACPRRPCSRTCARAARRRRRRRACWRSPVARNAEHRRLAGAGAEVRRLQRRFRRVTVPPAARADTVAFGGAALEDLRRPAPREPRRGGRRSGPGIPPSSSAARTAPCACAPPTSPAAT